MKILVTTDGSLRSLYVLPHAQAFAAATGSELVLLRVLDPTHDVQRQSGVAAYRSVAAVKARWSEELAGLFDAFGVSGDSVVSVMRKGERVHDTILRVADATAAAMIAMNSRGSGAVRHALFGSVAMGVVGCSRLPVLTAGPRFTAAKTRRRYRLLATTDGSDASCQVFRSMAPFLAGSKIVLTLFRVYLPTVGDRGDRYEMSECRYETDALRKTLPEGSRARVIVSRARALSTLQGEVLSKAEELHANAIAMSTHGHSADHHLLLGSTALSVLARSPVPIILARSQPRDGCR